MIYKAFCKMMQTIFGYYCLNLCSENCCKDENKVAYLLVFLFWIIVTTVFGQKETVIHINTDNYLKKLGGFYIDSVYGTMLGDVQYGYYNQPDSSYTDTIQIADSLSNISFVIYDSYGDGISALVVILYLYVMTL